VCFHSAVARGFNTFAFFTILSNLIVGATTLLLAIKPDLNSAIFKTFRLLGLAAAAAVADRRLGRQASS
jgi:hypothetical protein